MRRLAAVFAIAILSACSDGENSILLTTLPNSAKENLPRGAVAGDTIRLYAVEVGSDNEPTASLGRQNFTWSTTTPQLVDIPASGFVVTKGVPGRAQITVKGLEAERMFEIWLYPPDSRIRIDPREATVNAGETIPMTSTVVYGESSIFQDAANSEVGYTVVTTNPEIVRPSAGQKPPYTAVRTGSTYIRGIIELYKRAALRDSVRVTVR